MGAVHQLLADRGKQKALAEMEDRRVVEAAASYMGDEDGTIGFVYSGWAQAALPHKRLRNDEVWQITSERVKLLVEPGRKATDAGEAVFVGVPYGSRARLILIYLQTQALKSQSRDVELGRSLRDWLGRLGIPIGGKSLRDVREQADRISRCRLTFHAQFGNGGSNGKAGLVNQNIVDTAMFVAGGDSAQENLFVDTVRLSETFYEQLRKHPVPLEEAAIRAINNNSMALDIYCWLAYRLHVLPGAKTLTWKAIYGQFGAGYKEMFHFKPRFVESLNLALAVYPDARVEMDERGISLKPSRPPVPPRLIGGR
jgi:hypothetical protein